jgi:hypothetical protein
MENVSFPRRNTRRSSAYWLSHDIGWGFHFQVYSKKSTTVSGQCASECVHDIFMNVWCVKMGPYFTLVVAVILIQVSAEHLQIYKIEPKKKFNINVRVLQFI